eukprot:11005288-Alexandrium_andersonii.AAC.1
MAAASAHTLFRGPLKAGRRNNAWPSRVKAQLRVRHGSWQACRRACAAPCQRDPARRGTA